MMGQRNGIYQVPCLGPVARSLQLQHCTLPCSHDPFEDLLVLETKHQEPGVGSKNGNVLSRQV